MKKHTYLYHEGGDWLGIRFSRKADFKCIKIRVGQPPIHISFYIDKAGKPTEMIIPNAKARISPIDLKKLPKNKLLVLPKDKKR